MRKAAATMRKNGMQMKDRATGAMAGLALGDALGMPTQSMSAEQICRYYGGPITKLMNAVPQQPIAPNMKAGAVTDDTEQAFVLAQRLIDDNGCIDNGRYAHDLLQWEAAMKAKGSLDLLGPSTKAALQKLTEGVSPEETGRFGTTNGGAMRATPVGVAFRPGQALADAAWQSCVVTHNTVQGIEATTLVAAAVSFAVEGERDFLHLAVEFVQKLPQRGNWSAKASVLARVQYFMNWAETDGCRLNDDEFAAVLQRDCGTSVESNESVAALSHCDAFFDDPTQLCVSRLLLVATLTPLRLLRARCWDAWHGVQGFDETMLDRVLSQLDEDSHLDLVGTVTSLSALRDDSALNDANIV